MKLFKLDSREKQALQNAYKRLLIAFFATAFLIAAIVSYISFLNKRKAIFETQQAVIASSALDFNNYISYLVSVVRSIEADSYPLISAGDTDTLEDLFVERVADNPTIDQIRFLDLYGMETLRVNKATPSPYAVPEEELQDKSSRYYYTETTLLGRNQFLFSALDLNIENGVIEVDPVTGETKPTFRICTPIVVGEQRTGYFVVNFLMRDFLADLRTPSDIDGCTTFLFDENGYMFNYPEDAYNFGFSYPEGSAPRSYTINSFFPGVDLRVAKGSFAGENELCSYATYDNIVNLSKDYFLSQNASEKLYFMVSYGRQSAYANYIRYSPVHAIAESWETQILTFLVWGLLYFVIIFLFFLVNRTRFANYYSDNRFKKGPLKRAMHNHEFINYYQPVIDIQNGTLLGFETLVRWEKQNRILNPGDFLQEINNFELARALDEFVFEKIRADRKKMEEYGATSNIFVSINISRQTFEYMVKESGDAHIRISCGEKEYIVIELLEDIVMRKNIAEKIRELHDQGVHFAIDDFGTGNSNIAFIRSFTNMKIKIDRAFVPLDVNNKKERVMIEAFVQMFIDQGVKLIVEGVETREQYLYLKSLGVAAVQGFYFSKPLPLHAAIRFMREEEYRSKL